ncbi:MAG TPA: sodium:proton antiporter [Verrucomicrobiae bacterium]|nr:sodium:proton antiporter [Verrucomicrobiae bacterium]
MNRPIVRLSVYFFPFVLPFAASAADGTASPEPHPLMVLPFLTLLLAIAVMPFVNKHFWEHNYHKVAIGLGSIAVLYYILVLHNTPRMLTSLVEYVSFMALIGSLFVIAGGVHINMTGRSTPAVNTGLLALGALLANVIGTTGASMLLIRPFLRINKYRVAPYQVVLFIFIVSNIGGALTPIGDPPLFLGYLKGVPFFWLLGVPQVLLAWLLCVAALLTIFFVLDRRNFNQHKTEVVKAAKDRIELEGTHNFIFLFVIIGLVLLQKADWLKNVARWPMFGALGEALGWDAMKSTENVVTVVIAALMIVTAWLSYKFANKDALQENEFSFAPVREVGYLFIGIFTAMVPALDLLETHAAGLGIATPRQFFWGSGTLSSVLDNAPTYLNFLTAAFGLHHLSLENPNHVEMLLGNAEMCKYLVAVSLGSVFFGANTYIGNGPNFMVKSIAESRGVRCPSFFGYVFKYTLPILIPLFVAVSLLIF